MKKLSLKIFSIVLALVLAFAAMPISAYAEENYVYFSSDKSELKNIDFTYEIKVDDELYTGEVIGDDLEIYAAKDGLVTLPSDVEGGVSVNTDSNVSVKRLAYTDGKHLTVKESDTKLVKADNCEHYYTKFDDEDIDFITEEEFNEATNNGKNLEQVIYVDNTGKTYDESEVDIIKGSLVEGVGNINDLINSYIKDNPIVVPEPEFYYLKSSLQLYPISFNQSVTYKYDDSAALLKYNYSGSTTAKITSISLDSKTKTTEDFQFKNMRLDTAKVAAVGGLAGTLANVSSSILSDVSNQTGKTALLSDNILDITPTKEDLPTENKTKDYPSINTNIETFISVDKKVIYYSSDIAYYPEEIKFPVEIENTKCEYKTDVKPATLSKNGSVTTTCAICGANTKKTIYYPKTIIISDTAYTYDGKVKQPSVKVVDSDGKVIASSNYSVSYASGRKNVGKYSVTIKFKGNYSGTSTKSFVINPKNTTNLKLVAQKKGFKASWSKYTTQTTGYEIQYSTSSKFTSPKSVKITKNIIVSKSVSNLTAKKKYYVRIRTYRTYSGQTYYSSWSAAKSVTTKK